MNNNPYYITIFIFFFFYTSLSAQVQTRADSYIEYIKENKNNLPDDSLSIYYNKIAFNLNNIKSLYYLEEALKLSKVNKNIELQILTLGNLSNIHRLLGNNLKAIQYTLNAIELNEKLNKPLNVSLSFSQLAAIYYSDKNYEKAVYYYSKSIEKFPSKSETEINYLMILLNLGDAFRLTKQYENAIHNFNKSIKLNEKHKKSNTIYGYAYGNLGMAQMSLNQKKEAEKNLKLGVHYLKKIGDNHTSEIFNTELGKLYLQRGQVERAERIFLKAYTTFKELHTKEEIKDIASELEVFYEDRNQFEKALFYQKEYQLYKDSLVNKKAIQELEQAKHQFELNKMEFDMELME